MAKKLIINCGTCDVRSVAEETLAAYENILINCGEVLTTPESRNLLNRYGVTLNCGDVLEVEGDVHVSTINGSAQIKSTDTVKGRTYLNINGSLEIGPNTQAVLENYVGISVNGSVTCPESVSSCLGKIKVNGSTTCYPDEAIVLSRSAVIDRLFALRAKPKRYWSAKRMIMVDPQLDGEKLAAKGASFSSKEIIVAESKVESLIELIDEQAEVIIVPDGTAVILDDVELDDVTVKKHGARLYIAGDVKVTEESMDALARLEYLNIRGDARVEKEAQVLFMEKLTEISGDVKVSKGKHLEDRMSLRISKWMLEQEPEGISVSDCMKVRLDEDISRELILERLTISDCMRVICTEEQEEALSAVCEDVMKLGPSSIEDAEGSLDIGSIFKGVLGGAKELLDTKIINAGDYVL